MTNSMDSISSHGQLAAIAAREGCVPGCLGTNRSFGLIVGNTTAGTLEGNICVDHAQVNCMDMSRVDSSPDASFFIEVGMSRRTFKED